MRVIGACPSPGTVGLLFPENHFGDKIFKGNAMTMASIWVYEPQFRFSCHWIRNKFVLVGRNQSWKKTFITVIALKKADTPGSPIKGVSHKAEAEDVLLL